MINRRELTCGTGAATLLLASGAARAQGAPVEGRDFVRLNPPAPVAAGRQDRGRRVLLVRLPALQRLRAGMLDGRGSSACPPTWPSAACRSGFNAPFEGYARLYYALEAMGKLAESLHKRVFAAIHVQRQRLDKDADLANFVSARPASTAPSSSKPTSRSASPRRSRQAKQLSEAYKIDGVPARWASTGAGSRPARWPVATSVRWQVADLPDPARAQAGLSARAAGLPPAQGPVAARSPGFTPHEFRVIRRGCSMKRPLEWSASFVPS
jgi:thiol:disulfide interchange protein DsbA